MTDSSIPSLVFQSADFSYNNDFYQSLFQYYPKIMVDQIHNGKCILINGIDFERISNTEACYFMTKELRYCVAEPEVESATEIIGLPQSQGAVNPNDKYFKKHQSEEIPSTEYCICQKNHSVVVDDLLIQCDHCNEWYHPFCLRISKIEIALLNTYNKDLKWFCNRCLVYQH